MAFSNRRLVNGSITSAMHSEVSPVFWLSQWRTFSSSSVILFHSGHVVGALNHIQPSLLFGSLYWLSVSISYVLGALNVSQNLILKAWAMPFGVTFQYHNQKSMSSRFKVLSGSCLTAEDTLPCSLTRFASCWLILSWYLAVSQMEWVGKHELVLSHASEHVIWSCALQGYAQSPSLPWLLARC